MTDEVYPVKTPPGQMPSQQALLQQALQVQREASADQHKAADPASSVFVNANAGSGKTYLLVNRVIRLLLDGVPPQNILCLTYTRAAAAEMRTRLFDRLAAWIDLDDGELLHLIHHELDHKAFRHDDLQRARQLFALALETPGGLRVQTIHAFCERLLQAFPVEAGMPPGFEVMDEAETRALLLQARMRLLLGEGPGTGDDVADSEAADADTEMRKHLGLLAAHAGEERLQKLLEELLRHRRLLARMNASADFRRQVFAGLRQLLVIGENEPLEDDAWVAAWAEAQDAMHWQQLAQGLEPLALAARQQPQKLRANDHTVACLKQVAEALQDGRGADAWQVAREWFLTRENAPRKQLFTREVRDDPEAAALVAAVEALQEDVWLHHAGLLARRVYRANEALLHAGMAIHALYEQEKAWRGKFDYDDLVVRTLELLRKVDAQWVLWRLDGGIDHVLLDEAQDTAPEQWEILRLLTAEFTAGEGAQRSVPRQRTIFAVGDVKQSIYSFQGAAPEAFHEMSAFFRQQHKQAGLAFREVPLQVSFRTVQEILDVVDEVLNLPGFRLEDVQEEAEGQAAEKQAQEQEAQERQEPAGEEERTASPAQVQDETSGRRYRHVSARPHVRGFVELWPLEQGDDVAAAADDADAASADEAKQDADAALRQAVEALWTPPTEHEVLLKPRLRLAARIADTIRRWLDEGEALPPEEKTARTQQKMRTAASSDNGAGDDACTQQPQPAMPPRRQSPAQPRRIRPRDILILVRNRTTLMDAIISALKQRGIPVAGADRLKVTEHIAVQDMLALARFLLLPADDLSLATVLKSPLLARDDGRYFDDDDLLRLRGGVHDFSLPPDAVQRVEEERPLWAQLREAAQQGAPVRAAVRRLERWRGMAGFLPPYELLAHVLWRDGGLKRFVARLGEEALEPLEALLDMALQFEREEVASLSAFVQWLEQDAPQIKRELETGDGTNADDAGAVRVMTVHGAKGLEAPIVFLADTTSVPDRSKMLLIDAPLLAEDAAAVHGEELPLWPMKSTLQPPTVQALVKAQQRKDEEEYNRLLYVAMTRAADRLYICGAADGRAGGADEKGQSGKAGNSGSSGRKGGQGKRQVERIRSWHAWLSEVMCKEEYRVQLPDGRTVWRRPVDAALLRVPGEKAARVSGHESLQGASAPEQDLVQALQDWARKAPPPEPGPALWLAPSRLRQGLMEEDAVPSLQQGLQAVSDADDPVLSPLQVVDGGRQGAGDALQRGVLVHQLLQYLPEVSADQREQRALAWLRQVHGLTGRQAQDLWVEVAQVLSAEPMAQLFGPGSRAEVPFAARLPLENGREVVVSGQIDRLVVLEDAVLVADFKTARPIPASVEEVADAHVRQMAAYRHAMRRIWPRRKVRTILVYTAAPAWLELPEAMLADVLRAGNAG